MNIENFLYENLIIDKLKAILASYDLHVYGRKKDLISRIIKNPNISSLEVLLSINNSDLKKALKKHDLSSTGKKSDLILRVLMNNVVNLSDEEIIISLEKCDEDIFKEYCQIITFLHSSNSIPRILKQLQKASTSELHYFLKLIHSFPPKKTISFLIDSILTGNKNVPAFSMFLLEDILEKEGSMKPIVPLLKRKEDGIRARQRIIQNSLKANPELDSPAIQSLFKQIWSGTTLSFTNLNKELMNTRTGLKKEIKALQREKKQPGLQKVEETTNRIDKTTTDIQRGLQSLESQISSINNKIEKSPEEVVRALEKLTFSKEVRWSTRRKIKKDLKRVERITDIAQRIEFLTRIIREYGPVIISALKGLL